MTSTLLLRLAGPLQSWGDASRFTRRETRPEPTKSGVLGLLAAAQGRPRETGLSDLAALGFGVRVDQPGRLTRDFQTAIRRRGPKPVPMPLSYRYYLADAVFLAGVHGDDALVRSLAEALRRPVYPLFLGRRSCPTEGQVLLGVSSAGLEQALREHAWLASSTYRRRQGRQVHLPLALDCGALTGAAGDVETRWDVPISFRPEHRQYAVREIVHADPVSVDNPDGVDRMDFMAELGGGA